MSDAMQEGPEEMQPSTDQPQEGEPTAPGPSEPAAEEITPSERAAEAAAAAELPSEPMAQTPSEPMAGTPAPPSDLGARFEAELRRVRDAVTAAETAATAVGLRSTITGGRIECDYDLETDTIVLRSVSFELEF